MERDDLHGPALFRNDDAVVEALLAPGEGSFVDALLTLADEAANRNGADAARCAMGNGFQAALARQMRRSINRDGDGVVRSAA